MRDSKPTSLLFPERRLAAALLALALAARVVYGVCSPPPGSGGGRLADPDSYATLADSFSRTWTLSEDGVPSAHREPGYPVLLGLVFLLLGRGYGALLFLNSLLSTLALWAFWKVSRHVFGSRAALASLAVCAVYPPFLYYAAQSLRESMMLCLGSLMVWSLAAAQDSGRPARFLAAGLAGAAAGLTATVFLPFSLCCVPLLHLYLWRSRLRRGLLLGAVYLAGFLTLYGIWPLRNLRLFDAWILGSTASTGSTFYEYLVVPQEIGGTKEQGEYDARLRDPVIAQGGRIQNVVDRERFFFGKAVERVRSDPWRYVWLVGWRIADYWRLVPRPRAYEHSYGLLKWVSLLTDGWIIPLAFLGMALAGARGGPALWIYAFVFSLNFSYALVLTTIRYRLPVMAWMILFATAGAGRLWELARRRMPAVRMPTAR
ncbi:MAG: glycosyltransferase family 39 protein [Elusimicrobia bacterium]|nr:glycosyltransferase family 39 protein [Elusimicrobiota bacterium]